MGVVFSIRHRGLDSEEDRQFYFSYQQFTDGRIVFVVRSRVDVCGMTLAVLQAIWFFDSEQLVYDVRTMDDVFARSAVERWLNMAIIGVFAVSSLLLVGVGLYGVIACSVTERLCEFGVRMALGAMLFEVLRLVLRKGTVLAASGAALGLGGAIVLARAMESLLFGVSFFDPVSFAAVAALLFGVALAASYLSARRAVFADPIHSFRAE